MGPNRTRPRIYYGHVNTASTEPATSCILGKSRSGLAQRCAVPKQEHRPNPHVTMLKLRYLHKLTDLPALARQGKASRARAREEGAPGRRRAPNHLVPVFFWVGIPSPLLRYIYQGVYGLCATSKATERRRDRCDVYIPRKHTQLRAP